jgi:uncharacterized membrane protein YkoI
MKIDQKGSAHAVVMSVVAVVLVAGLGLYVSKSSKNAPLLSQEVANENSTLKAPLPADLMTVDAVKALITTATPGTALTSVELQQEGGKYLYRVKLAGGSTVFYDAKTGVLVTHAKTDDDTETDESPASLATKITLDQAKSIAQTARPAGVISKIELEAEEGKVVYNVRFVDGARINVDADSGAILKTVEPKVKKVDSTTKTPETKKAEDSTKSPENETKSDTSSTPTSSVDTDTDTDTDTNSGSGSSGSGKNGGR